jgi:flagellar basal-body rod modification protein FlgD
MSTIASVSSASSAYSGAASLPAAKKTSLGSEDFMRLLAVQFQSQDPMKPMEDTAFIAQMAQFSALDQSSSLVKEMALLRADQQNLSASSMLGRIVTVTDDDGMPVMGQVSAVENSDKGPVLLIDGHRFSLSSVQRVEYTPPVYTQIQTDLPPAA